MKIERETVEGEKAVRVTFGHWSFACIFIVAWLSFWSLGCWMLVRALIAKFTLTGLVFALPFFAAWVGVAWLVLFMIFGKTVFTFTRSGCTKKSGIGRFAIKKEFTFPVKCKIATDEQMIPSKNGTQINYRLVVETPFDLDGPRVIYSSRRHEIVESLCKAAKSAMNRSSDSPARKKTAEAIAAEDARAERRDLELLAGKPPVGIAIARDCEGRLFVTCRHIGWIFVAILTFAIAFFGVMLWKMPFQDMPLIGRMVSCFAVVFPASLLLWVLLGKRTLTLDHGNGETFAGVWKFGWRKRFQYGSSFDISLVDSDMWINSERMKEIVLAKPDGETMKVCASWPNKVKPYLVAVLRHPGSCHIHKSIAYAFKRDQN